MNWFLHWWTKEAISCEVVNGFTRCTHLIPWTEGETETVLVPMFKIHNRYVGTCPCGRKYIS